MPPLQVDQSMLEFFKSTQLTDIVLTLYQNFMVRLLDIPHTLIKDHEQLKFMLIRTPLLASLFS